MARAALVALLALPAAQCAPQLDLDPADLVRAKTPRPGSGSPVAGRTAAEAFAGMSRALRVSGLPTRPCESFGHAQLNELARTLHAARSPELQRIYQAKGDKRALHFDSLSYKERLWAGEAAAERLPSHAPGTAEWNATRDGKCAELVMWWTHHLAAPARRRVAQTLDFALPEMPRDVAPRGVGGHEYALQIVCTDCHLPIHQPGKPPIPPVPPRNGTGPQFPTSCPKVWYNRTKRCDWDYEPFCRPCEGIGGLAWGNGEHEWNPMPCEPLMTPEQIPADNLTSPIWPKSFTVDEYAMLTFPGTDACDVKWRNSTYTLYYDTRADGPLYHTVGHSGPSGPSPFPGSSWGLANGNFYNTVDLFGKGIFCLCISPPCGTPPCPANTVVGPLRYNFNDNAKLVGRERIVAEYLNKEMVADHWVKGPHHFWIEVATNLMVREWQPFNGHQIYYNWKVAVPDPKVIDVPELCYKGILHFNASCVAPPPSSA